MDKNKPHRFMFGMRCECLHNSVHSACIGDEQKQQTQSYTPSGSEHAPLLKGLCQLLRRSCASRNLLNAAQLHEKLHLKWPAMAE